MIMRIAVISLGRSHLINLARELDKIDEVETFFYTMMPKSRCRKFGYFGKVVSCLFPIGILSVLIEKIPFLNPYRRSYLRIRLRLFFDKWVSWQLKKCDVLIGLNGTAVRCSERAKKKFGAITICDQGSSHILTQDAARRSYTDNEPPQLNTDYMLKHYKVVDYLMSPAEYVKQSDIQNGIAKYKILYNPYGVNLDIFKPVDIEKEKEYDVIMVGSWWKHKGCDMLAEACINRLGLRLLHVGSRIDCPFPDSHLFTHVDFVPESELPKYYAKAKVFAMPSLDEGFGLVLLQAAACGLPIVGSTRTGSPDVAKLLGNPRECFTIEEPLTVESVVKAIKKAIQSANELHDGCGYASAKTLQNISWGAYGKRYFEIISKVLNR